MRLPSRPSLSTLMGLGLLVLVILVWFLGPTMGLQRPGLRFALIFMFLVLGLLALRFGPSLNGRLRRHQRRSRHGGDLQRPLATRLDQVMAAQGASLQGRRARRRTQPLLPWYLVMGDSGSGKSTALRESGLDFPFADQGAAPQSAPSGTCDWCLTPQAVFLDVPGTWMSGDEGRDHWLALLRLVRRRRPTPALQGILLCLPLPTLAAAEAAVIHRLASRLRQRLSEAEDLLHQTPPLYLLLTHLDRLEGSALLLQRAQSGLEPGPSRLLLPWAPTDPPQDPDPALATALAQFRQVLSAHLWRKETAPPRDSRPGDTAPDLALLPAWDEVQEGLRRFVSRLCERHPGRRAPHLRGLHFTSARQDGLQVRQVSRRIALQFALAPPPSGSCPSTGSSHGLRTFFAETLPADRALASQGWRPSPTRRGILAGSSLILLGLSFAWGWSFVLNRRRITLMALEHRVARATLTGTHSLPAQLEALQRLQVRLEPLRRYRINGAPWSLRWGLDPGPRLERQLLLTYDPGVRRLMLQPIQAAVEARLRTWLASGAKDLPAHGDPASTEAYRLLKTELMLGCRDRMEAAHIVDQWPSLWRAWLESQVAEPERSACLPRAERMLAFHVARIEEPDLPVLAPDLNLVATVRERLTADLRALPPQERVYKSILARVGTRFPALTLAQILEGRDLDLLLSTQGVPGVFTRQAWEGGIRDALESAARGQGQDGDWVLGPELTLPLTRQGDAPSNLSRLLALYKADTARAWQSFLQGVTMPTWSGPDEAARALARLSEAQRSPIGRLLSRASKETGWDGPSPLDRTVEGFRQRVARKASDLLGTEAPASPAGAGELGGQFSAVQYLVGKDQGQTALAPYYACLQKLQARMAAVAASPDPAMAARQWCQSGPLGAPELTEASLVIERALPQTTQESERAVLRTFLLRPFQQVGPGVGSLAEQDLQRTWTQQVLPAWEGLASRYPFTDSPQDAGLPEIQKLLHPTEGQLGQFIQGSLGASVIRRGEGLAGRNLNGQGPRLSPGALGALSRMITASDKVLRDVSPIRFECQATGTRGIREIHLEIDGQRLVYRNGVETWTPFTWPGPVPGQGARLQLVTHDGTGFTLASFQGPLALIRLLEMARQIPTKDGATALEWNLRPEPPRPGARDDPSRTLRILLRPSSGSNPLHFLLLRHQALPQRLTL